MVPAMGSMVNSVQSRGSVALLSRRQFPGPLAAKFDMLSRSAKLIFAMTP